MEKEIIDFAKAIGAIIPDANSEFKHIFPRDNYFVLDRKIMVIKISRSYKPFYGLRKAYIDFLNEIGFDYYLILLKNNNTGWLFSKQEVNQRIKKYIFKLRKKDLEYKINFPHDADSISNKNFFRSPEDCLKKIV